MSRELKDYQYNTDLSKKILAIEPLSREEEAALFKEVAQGNEEARIKILESCYRFIWRETICCCAETNGYNYFEDALMVGIKTTLHCIDSFKISEGFRFITYLKTALPSQIKRYLRNNRNFIRLSTDDMFRFSCYHAALGYYKRYNDDEPSDEYLLQKLKISPKKLGLLKTFEKALTTSVSLDQLKLIHDELEDCEDESLIITDDKETEELKEIINQVLAILPASYQEIILIRYGFYDGIAHSLLETAEIIGCTRSNIHKKEQKALSLMKTAYQIYNSENYQQKKNVYAPQFKNLPIKRLD